MSATVPIPAPTLSEHARARREPRPAAGVPSPRRTVLLTILAFSVCSAAAAVRSKGFLETDGGTHYLYARHALAEPHYLVNVWGRPLCTALFALPAHSFGLLGVRLTSLAVAVGCGLVAWRIAAGQGRRRPELALVFTLGMPLVFLHSFAELTELPFALVIGLAFWAYQRRKFGWMALLAGLSPLGRPEGFGFVVLAAIALVAHRKALPLLVLPAGLLLWSLVGPVWSGQADVPWYRWLIANWPYASVSAYASGSIFHFFNRLPMLVGPFALPAMWFGMARGLRCDRPTGADHLSRARWLTAALPLAVLAGHSLLYATGRMASDGELRYLLVVAPLWGVLCADGWAWAFDALGWRGAGRWAALAVVAPGLVNYDWRILPVAEPVSWEEAHRLAAWYVRSPASRHYPKVLTAHTGIFYYADLSPTDPQRVEQWSKRAVSHPEPGVILMWDPEFALRNASADRVVTLDDVLAAGWVPDPAAEFGSQVNNPPPWADYKVLNPPPEPRDKSLRNLTMLWHVFLSPAGAIDGPAREKEIVPRIDTNNHESR